ncbi:MAG: thioredoxin family protein [Planctomycetota bacterium]|nr:thioredoxin family protein [Planctomycetota bacterium]
MLSIGDEAPMWSDLPGTDGEKHSLADLKDKSIVVVVFTCNSCPYAVDYEDRIVSFSKKYATSDSDVALIAINVNKIDEDLLPLMKVKADEKGFTFPYLFDESQKVAKDFGAGNTPEFFVIDRDRKIVYMGAMDDDTDAEKAQVNYVELAVDAAREGKKPETTETIPIGCRIRFVRERKKS